MDYVVCYDPGEGLNPASSLIYGPFPPEMTEGWLEQHLHDPSEGFDIPDPETVSDQVVDYIEEQITDRAMNDPDHFCYQIWENGGAHLVLPGTMPEHLPGGMTVQICTLDHEEYGRIAFEVPADMPPTVCPWHDVDPIAFDRKAYEETMNRKLNPASEISL